MSLYKTTFSDNIFGKKLKNIFVCDIMLIRKVGEYI